MNTGFKETVINGLPCLTVPSFTDCGVKHMFTVRAGGVSEGICASMNFRAGHGLDTLENVRKNMAIVSRAMDSSPDRLVCTKQVHKTDVFAATADDAGRGSVRPSGWEVDGLVSSDPSLLLAGFYADCAVVLLHDRRTGASGTVHSGWRGTAGGIVNEALGKMSAHFGTSPRDVIAAVGPAICRDCFETDSDVPEAITRLLGADAAPYIEKRGEKYHVDIAGVISHQLKAAGVPDGSITLSGLCTSCQGGDMLWSHRRTHGLRGVHGAFIRASGKQDK